MYYSNTCQSAHLLLTLHAIIVEQGPSRDTLPGQVDTITQSGDLLISKNVRDLLANLSLWCIFDFQAHVFKVWAEVFRTNVHPSRFRRIQDVCDSNGLEVVNLSQGSSIPA